MKNLVIHRKFSVLQFKLICIKNKLSKQSNDNLFEQQLYVHAIKTKHLKIKSMTQVFFQFK